MATPSHPRDGRTMTTPTPRPAWTLLTNHGHVLLAVADEPDARVAEIAAAVGITPRATLTILHDLQEAGYVRRTKIGRRTHYTVNPDQHFRHPTLADHEIRELLTLITGTHPPPEHSTRHHHQSEALGYTPTPQTELCVLRQVLRRPVLDSLE